MAKAIVQNFLILLCFISFYDFLFVHHINVGIAPKVNIRTEYFMGGILNVNFYGFYMMYDGSCGHELCECYPRFTANLH